MSHVETRTGEVANSISQIPFRTSAVQRRLENCLIKVSGLRMAAELRQLRGVFPNGCRISRTASAVHRRFENRSIEQNEEPFCWPFNEGLTTTLSGLVV